MDFFARIAATTAFQVFGDPLNSDNPYTVESQGKKVVVVPYNVPGCNDCSTYGAGGAPPEISCR